MRTKQILAEQIDEKISIKPHIIQAELWQNALKNDIPCVFWQLPNTKKIHFVADFGKNITYGDLELEQNIKGFAISPFLNPDIQQTYFIHADLYWHSEMQIYNESDLFGKSMQENHAKNHKKDTEKIDIFFENLELKKIKKHTPQFNFKEKLKNITLKNTNPEKHFKEIVQKAVSEMQAQQYDKVVLSRQKWVDYPTQDFEILEFFDDLTRAYPTAFCYVFYLPNIGIWAGATPELLLETDKNNTFKTVALAGTQAHQPNTPHTDVQWGQKEIEEQAMVSRYIINCFKKIRLREFSETGPKTVQAGNLLHLKTFFSVDMHATNFPNLGTVMLPLLHPTSAVCGMPKTESMQFILENEQYNREFYTGFLGAINIDNANNLFVNLRCLQFFQQKICLYVGAGITENSIPEKEWKETEIKSQTLLNILVKSVE